MGKKLYSEEFDAYKKCLELLSKLCKPGRDMKMDGDHHEKPTGEGFCEGFFGARKKIREKARNRAKECVAISKKTQDMASSEYKSCHGYMVKLCDPGEDLLMDGDEKENPTGKGYCQEFFRKKKEDENAEKKDGKNGEGGGKGKKSSEGMCGDIKKDTGHGFK